MAKEKKAKKFLTEFKEFIAKGNAFNLAVGVIIGAAFQGIVNSLVNDIIMPVLGIILNGIDFSNLAYEFTNPLTEEIVKISYGNFISAIINFLVMAFVIFLLVKLMARVTDKMSKKEEEEAPATKECPYCKSEIALEAVKCPHCTSDVE